MISIFMKFKIFFIIILLISCNNNKKSSTDTVEKKSDAENIILYNNVLIKFVNDADRKMSQVARELNNLSFGVENKNASKILSRFAFASSIDPELESKFQGVNLLEPEDYIPSEYQDSLVYYTKNAHQAYGNVKESYTSFDKYLKNEDYADDDWKSAGEYIKEMDKNLGIFFNNKIKLLQKIKPLADKAEEKILEDHPYGEAIITAKKDLGLALDIENLIFSEQINYKTIEEKYAALESNYEKNKEANLSALKEYRKDKQYNNFYNSLESFIGLVRKAKRDGVIDENEAKEIDRKYSSLISFYNTFVQ